MYFDMTGIDHQPLEIRLLYHRFQHFFPDALVSPATETPLDSIPLTIFRRQVSPWCSRSQNPEHAIQKLTGILCVPSPRSLVSYCVRLENFPHRIGHIVPSIAVLHEETPLCVFLHYTTKRHFCRQCLANRVAILTGTTASDIIQIYTNMLNCYSYRSESLHEGIRTNISIDELHNLEQYVRDVLKKCLQRCKNSSAINLTVTWNEVKRELVDDLKSGVTAAKTSGILPS